MYSINKKPKESIKKTQKKYGKSEIMWTDCENTIPDIGDACFSKSCKRNSMVNYAKLNLLNGSKIFYYHTKSRLTTSSASTCVSEQRTVKILSVY